MNEKERKRVLNRIARIESIVHNFRKNYRVIAFDTWRKRVQLNYELFSDLFEAFKVEATPYNQYELSAEYKDIEYFALIDTKEAQKHGIQI